MGDSRTVSASVIVLSVAASVPAALGGNFAEHPDVTVTAADSLDAVTERLDADETVGCVVVVDDVEDPVAVTEHCHASDPDLPLIVATGGPGLVPDVTRYGNVRFLGDGVGDATLRECLLDALETRKRRLERRADATVLHSYMEHLRHAMWVTDADGENVRTSRTPRGLGPADVTGREAETRNRSEDAVGDGDAEADGDRDARLDDAERRIVEGGEPVHCREEHIETKTGTQWFRTSQGPWYDEDGDVRGIVGLSWDVTDEMLLKEQLAAQEDAFEEFASSISHDIRTPLQVARGNLELARESDEETPLENADRALDRIVQMIEDLEAVASEHQALSVTDVGPDGDSAVSSTALHDVSRHLWSVLNTTGATLDLAIDDDTIVVADETSMRPLLENLFTNAITHGGDDVTVRLGAIDGGGFYVADDGPGIPPDRRDAVLREGYTTTEAGSGRGLSIVDGIANRNGWEIRITDSEMGGARLEFHNCLLVERPPPEPAGVTRTTLSESDDVGDVLESGNARYDGGQNRWIVEGAGSNIWRDENEFHYCYATVDGPVRIEGRVADIDQRSQYAKAGLMVRASLDEDAPYGYVGVTPKHGTELLWRTATGEPGVSQQLGETPLSLPWYRVDRRGEVVTLSVSADGEAWHHVDQRSIDVDDPIVVGLVVCSHVRGTLCQATFDAVSVERLDVDH